MQPRLLSFALAVTAAFAEDKAAYTFGTTVVDSSGLQGRVFHVDRDIEELPKLRRMKPVGTVYTLSLNVWPQRFDEGFPNISDRFEWFAIEYTGKFGSKNPASISSAFSRMMEQNSLSMTRSSLTMTASTWRRRLVPQQT